MTVLRKECAHSVTIFQIFKIQSAGLIYIRIASAVRLCLITIRSHICTI